MRRWRHANGLRYSFNLSICMLYGCLYFLQSFDLRFRDKLFFFFFSMKGWFFCCVACSLQALFGLAATTGLPVEMQDIWIEWVRLAYFRLGRVPQSPRAAGSDVVEPPAVRPGFFLGGLRSFAFCLRSDEFRCSSSPLGWMWWSHRPSGRCFFFWVSLCYVLFPACFPSLRRRRLQSEDVPDTLG